jgi:Holliday junction resolvasome RuvABC endonuclease subunit
MFLGLDLSLQSTGVCGLADSTCAETEALCFPSTTGIDRLHLIIHGIEDFMGRFGGAGSFELAAIEGYAYAGSGKNFHLAELGGLVRWHLTIWKVPFIVVPIGSLKRFWTGNGNADKVQMSQVAKLVYDRDFLLDKWPGKARNKPRPDDWGLKDVHYRDDECDAFALANAAALYHGGWDRLATFDQQAIVQELRLDPQGILSKEAKQRKALKDQMTLGGRRKKK